MTATVTDYELIQHLDFDANPGWEENKNCFMGHGVWENYCILNPCSEDPNTTMVQGCKRCVTECASKDSSQTWKFTFNPSGRTRTYGPGDKAIRETVSK